MLGSQSNWSKSIAPPPRLQILIVPRHTSLAFGDQPLPNSSKYFSKRSPYSWGVSFGSWGGLFEGKFKSQHLGTDQYLKYTFSYIRLNPVKLIDSGWKEKGIKNKNTTVDYLKKYIYSSFLDYRGVDRIQNKILNKKSFPKYFPTTKDFIKEIFDWLIYTELIN